MPKLKTHQATAKRIKVTATGKLLRRRGGGKHHLLKKGANRKRAIAVGSSLKGSAAAQLKRALGA